MSQILSTAGIKRQIIAESDITGIRKRIASELTREQCADYIKMGEAFEKLVQTEAWVYLQAYMMKHIMNSLLLDTDKALTRGFINLMHYVDQVIKAKDDLKVNTQNETV